MASVHPDQSQVKNEPVVIEAQQFIVRDAEGRKRAAFGMTEFRGGIAPSIDLFDPEGRPRLNMATMDDGHTFIRLTGQDGLHRLMIDTHGSMFDQDGQPRIRLSDGGRDLLTLSLERDSTQPRDNTLWPVVKFMAADGSEMKSFGEEKTTVDDYYFRVLIVERPDREEFQPTYWGDVPESARVLSFMDDAGDYGEAVASMKGFNTAELEAGEDSTKWAVIVAPGIEISIGSCGCRQPATFARTLPQ